MTQEQANQTILALNSLGELILTYQERATSIKAFVDANGGWGEGTVIPAAMTTAYPHLVAISSFLDESLDEWQNTRSKLFHATLSAPKV